METAQAELKRMQDKCWELQKKVDDSNRTANTYGGLLSAEQQKVYEINRQLFEIVRWLINKDTAMYPFEKEKGQKGQNDYPKSNNLY